MTTKVTTSLITHLGTSLAAIIESLIVGGGGGGGSGDMLKSTYDTNNNGKADVADRAEGAGNYADYTELPTSIGSGSNSGIPNRATTAFKVQAGSLASPVTDNATRAISSQAIVNATYPWTNPSHWSPNEFSVVNKGTGRVNALNAVHVTDTDLNMDNTAYYSYSKNSYVGAKTGLGGIVGQWMILDTRGSPTRAVGSEIVILTDHTNRYDVEPKSTLSENPADASTAGLFHAGMRISTLLSSKIITRGLDIITGNDTAGFDTGVNLQAFRSRALYIHNNLNPSVGGDRVGVEFADSVMTPLRVKSPGGHNINFEQNYSASLGWYGTFRKDASNTWLSMYPDGTVSISGNVSTGSKMVVYPDGRIYAGHSTATNAGFQVPSGGKFWLNSAGTSYIQEAGGNIILVKNGSVVATW